MSKKLKQIAQKKDWLIPAMKAGLYACLFMPLIVSGSYIFPYIFPKQAFLQIIVEIMMGLYLFLAMRQPQYRPKTSWLFKALCGYYVVVVLSAILGANAFHSFWSDFERMAGVISLLHYFAFLFIAANVLKTKEEWRRFFDFAIIASFLEALYALGQLLKGNAGRLEGTIGNSSFLAGYMLLSSLFALWLFLEKKDLGWKIFYGASIFLDMVVLYSTQTRGAILALGAGLIALALFIIFAPAKGLNEIPFRKPARLKNYALALLVFIFLAGGSIWLLRDSQFIKKFPTISRVANISISESTSNTRLLAWRMSLQGFAEHPIFGWGNENYYIIFNKFYNPHLYPVESWFDRSHNAFLDVLVNTGLVGFVLYISIFFLSFRYLWLAWKKEKIQYYTAVIFSVILIVYAIQNFFVFDTQVTLLMISLILSFMAFLSFEEKDIAESEPMKPNFLFGALVIIFVISSLYYFNIKPASAGAIGIDAMKYLQTGQIVKANESFKIAYSIGTFGLPEVAMRAQDSALQFLGSGKELTADQKELVAIAIDGIKKSLELEPENTRFMMMLGNLYVASANFDPGNIAQADLLYQKALELSPTRQELYFALGQLRYYQGRIGEVLPFFQKAVELNDKVAISCWNYGVMASALGQKDLGKKEIEKAVELGHSFNDKDIDLLISIYSKNNDFPELIFLYQEKIKLNPKDPAPYANLSAVYAQMGDKQKAKAMALKAVSLDPSYQSEAEQFIKGLGL